MSMSDPIADMLTRVRNAQMIGRSSVLVPHSRLKELLANVLLEEGYLDRVSVQNSSGGRMGARKMMRLGLKYFDGNPVIEKIKRVSRPGLRVYLGSDNIPQVMGGGGIVVVSTSKGVMTGRQAGVFGLGGEVLCRVE